MFDIGFWELLILGIVALLVVGPERLPSLARTLGAWLGKAKRMISSVKAEIDQELRAEELKRILNNQENSLSSHSILEDVKQDVEEIKQEVKASIDEAQLADSAIEKQSEK